ncbi:hypothetical protein TRFO_42702 [Tritrichomonas foetus]|uniref:non-specific serine/threonine protein kinase n=1 Tax=Tritrichomonas foetus TaxID=1144522 RepID=A0A1J4KV71_9EUKA|nr:hypothetical protein TRFO_42702 [Tritrichomonas foetus]|eukprot:OHT15131.1 hypothetical protein TRFO_42702 [Tritrichomonas foetus]
MSFTIKEIGNDVKSAIESISANKTLAMLYQSFNYYEVDINHPKFNYIVFSILLEAPFVTYAFTNNESILIHVLCVEKKCYILKEKNCQQENNQQANDQMNDASKDNKNTIFNLIFSVCQSLKKTIFNLSDTEDKPEYKDAIEEAQSFVDYFKDLLTNDFIKQTIKPLCSFMIRRFYFKQTFFKDPSFFDIKIHDNNNYIISSTDFLKLRDFEDGKTSNDCMAIHLHTLYVVAIKYYTFANQDNFQSNPLSFISTESSISNSSASLHQNSLLMKVYGTFYDDNKKQNCIVMPFMCKGTLAKNVDNFSVQRKLQIFYRLVEIVEFLHSQNLVHNQISQESIYIDNNYVPYLNINYKDMSTYGKDIKSENMNVNNNNDVNKNESEIMNGSDCYLANIYSLGMVLFFLFTEPYNEQNNESKSDLNNESTNNSPSFPQNFSFLQDIYNQCIRKRTKYDKKIFQQLYNSFEILNGYSYFEEKFITFDFSKLSKERSERIISYSQKSTINNNKNKTSLDNHEDNELENHGKIHTKDSTTENTTKNVNNVEIIIEDDEDIETKNAQIKEYEDKGLCIEEFDPRFFRKPVITNENPILKRLYDLMQNNLSLEVITDDQRKFEGTLVGIDGIGNIMIYNEKLETLNIIKLSFIYSIKEIEAQSGQ